MTARRDGVMAPHNGSLLAIAIHAATRSPYPRGVIHQLRAHETRARRSSGGSVVVRRQHPTPPPPRAALAPHGSQSPAHSPTRTPHHSRSILIRLYCLGSPHPSITTPHPPRRVSRSPVRLARRVVCRVTLTRNQERDASTACTILLQNLPTLKPTRDYMLRPFALVSSVSFIIVAQCRRGARRAASDARVCGDAWLDSTVHSALCGGQT